jgi:hypothetical protein
MFKMTRMNFFPLTLPTDLALTRFNSTGDREDRLENVTNIATANATHRTIEIPLRMLKTLHNVVVQPVYNRNRETLPTR